MVQVLTALGVDRKKVYARYCRRPRAGSFWQLPGRYRLDIILEAHKRSRQAMKRAHADKGGGHEKAVKYNQLHDRLHELAGRHGCEEVIL